MAVKKLDEKKADEAQELVLAYGRLFNTLDGQKVWKDLARTFEREARLDEMNPTGDRALFVLGEASVIKKIRSLRRMAEQIMESLEGKKGLQKVAILGDEEE